MIEDRALFLDRSRIEQQARIDAVELGEQMRGADEPAQQTALVNAVREAADAASADQVAAFPIAARRLVDMRADVALIGVEIVTAGGVAEEAQEARVIRQVPGRGELQRAERDMRGVEIDRGDRGGVGGQVRQRVAAARRDGDDVAVRRDRQRAISTTGSSQICA